MDARIAELVGVAKIEEIQATLAARNTVGGNKEIKSTEEQE
jgi:hypothetical protein